MDDSRHIENLIYRYAQRIDAGNLEGVAELFRDASIVSTQHNSHQSGYDAVLKMYQMSCRIHEPSGTPLTKHLTTNVIIDINQDGLTANAHSYYTVIQAAGALTLQPIISGRYNDDFRKVGGQWQFSQREMFVDLIGDLSAHLLYDASQL